MMHRYVQQFPAMPPLVIVVKFFLKQRGLDETYTGGIGSYVLANLVVSFLQQHPRWAHFGQRPEEMLGVALVEFFQMFGTLVNYDQVTQWQAFDGRLVEVVAGRDLGPQWRILFPKDSESRSQLERHQQTRPSVPRRSPQAGEGRRGTFFQMGRHTTRLWVCAQKAASSTEGRNSIESREVSTGARDRKRTPCVETGCSQTNR